MTFQVNFYPEMKGKYFNGHRHSMLDLKKNLI